MGRWPVGSAFPGKRLNDLAVAARIHDIGKLAIPAQVLDKQGPLEPIEWVAIRRHAIVGEQILVSVPELRGAARLVRHSH
jgi:HD-GYP domain-containing protein (c-di-GMP phosphodiesterase class II)